MSDLVNIAAPIEALKDFYLDNEVTLKLVQMDESRLKKSWSEEEMGHWALEQIETAASTLMVTKFIVKGGEEVPVLEELDSYVTRNLGKKEAKLMQLEEVLPIKKARFDLLTSRLRDLEYSKRKLQKELDERSSTESNEPQAQPGSKPLSAKKDIKADISRMILLQIFQVNLFYRSMC